MGQEGWLSYSDMIQWISIYNYSCFFPLSSTGRMRGFFLVGTWVGYDEAREISVDQLFHIDELKIIFITPNNQALVSPTLYTWDKFISLSASEMVPPYASLTVPLRSPVEQPVSTTLDALAPASLHCWVNLRASLLTLGMQMHLLIWLHLWRLSDLCVSRISWNVCEHPDYWALTWSLWLARFGMEQEFAFLMNSQVRSVWEFSSGNNNWY